MTAGVDRSRAPRAAPLPPADLPPFTRERLPSGLELLMCPWPTVPLVHLTLQLDAGGERNPLDRPGLASLTGALVDEGTRRRSGPEIAAALERRGATLRVGTDWSACRIEVDALAGDLETALRVVAELAEEASFPDSEVERLRRQTLAEIARRRDRPGLLADLALARELYRGTPFGHSGAGSEAALRALTREEVVAFYAAHFASPRRSLVVCGDFDPGRARELADAVLAAPGAASPPPEIAPPPSRGSRVRIIDLPHAAQSELRLGQVGLPRRHPDRTRFGLLNALFGGKFTSRLNLNLRERHGYTYGAASRLSDRRSAGPWVVAAAVANEAVGAAVHETMAELRRLLDEPVAADELAESRDYLVGVFPFTLQTAEGVAARLADLALHELPSDHFGAALREVESTTATELLALARRHLRPREIVVAIAGPAERLAAQLAGWGEIEVLQPEALDEE